MVSGKTGVSISYTPKITDENVNISKQSPIREFLKLLVGIVVSITVLYFVLGGIVNLAVPFVSVAAEKKIGSLVSGGMRTKLTFDKSVKVQSILDTLLPHLENNPFDITISVAKSSTVNAVALPGGHIVIFQGLLDEISSDRELAFVIGHELGHFVNRDHLTGLGRGLSLVFIAMLLGNDNGLSSALLSPLDFSERRFSQKQEKKADAVGLDLLYKAYGTTGGSVSFFRKLQKENKISDFAYFFATHPSPEERITALERLIEKKYGEKVVGDE